MISLLLSLVPAAFAASITINDPGCAGFTTANAPGGSLNITCSVTPPTPPPPVDSCPANTLNLKLSYVKGQQARAVQTPFGNNQILVVKFTTPAADKFAPGGTGGSISIVHYPGPNATRTIALSTTPCDFTKAGQNWAIGDSPGIRFNSDTTKGVPLKPLTTYYLSVKNATATGQPSCGAADGNCPVQASLSAR